MDGLSLSCLRCGTRVAVERSAGGAPGAPPWPAMVIGHRLYGRRHPGRKIFLPGADALFDRHQPMPDWSGMVRGEALEPGTIRTSGVSPLPVRPLVTRSLPADAGFLYPR